MMKRMRKLIAAAVVLLLVLTLVLPFAACDEGNGGGGGNGGGTNKPTGAEEYWVERIEVTKGEGFQEDYADGDVFNTTGLTVKAYWNDGYIEENVSSTKYTVIPSVITEGVTEVTVIYGDARLTIPISSAKIVGLDIVKLPSNTTYFVDEVFKADGIVLRYALDNSSYREIPDFDATLVTFPDTPLAIGDTEVEISYGGYTCKVPVTVKGRGFKIEANAEENVEMSGTEGYKAGTNAVIKQYASNGDFMQDFAVGSVMTFTFESDTPQVNLLLQAASTYVTEYSKVVTYIPIVVEDMQVSRIFDMTVNGRTVPISDQAVLAGQEAEDKTNGDLACLANWTEVNLGIVDVYTDQINTVSLTFKDNGYRNQNTTTGMLTGKMPAPYIDYFMVSNVEEDETVTAIEITSPPQKTVYVEGQSFDRTGMVVTATHKDGSRTEVDYYNIIPSGALTELGENTITVAYAECTAETTVNVIAKVQTGIYISNPPDATSYGRGQTFDRTGMVVKATYNDGSETLVTDYTVTPSGVLTPGTTEVTIGHNGFTVTQAVTVTDEDLLQKITIAGVPTTALTAGDELPAVTASDLTVTAHYFSGRTETVAADDYDLIIPTGEAAIGSAVIATLKSDSSMIAVSTFNVSAELNIVSDMVTGEKNYRSAVAWAAGAKDDDFMQNCRGNSVITFNVVSASDSYANLVLTGASGWVLTYSGSLPLVMGEMQANVMFDLEVNGEIVAVPDSAVFEGKTFETASNNNLANWSDADLGAVRLQAGNNVIRLVFKNYTYENGNTQKSVATPNLDYLTVTSVN